MYCLSLFYHLSLWETVIGFLQYKTFNINGHYLFCVFQEHILSKPRAYYRIDQSAEPDVWLDAVQVWEVKCADLSLSPVYKAAMGMVSSAC